MMVVDEVRNLFETRGNGRYGGEAVTQAQHALQAADLARNAGAQPALIVAALLHDVGHLLPVDEFAGDVDGFHEQAGAAWLETRFGPEISEPARLHVAAKRYLCATDSAYAGKLSAESVRTLALQGGAMDEAEARAFERHPQFAAAVRVRSWDDQAKVPGLEVAPLETYFPLIAELSR